VVKKVNGLKVGVIGVLMNDLLEHYSTPKLIGPYHTIPPVEAVRRHVKKLRKKSDLIVVLAHTSGEDAEAIAREIPEVSVVVSGHLHNGMPEMGRVGNAVIVRAKGYGVEVGRLELSYDKRERRLTQTKWTQLKVDSTVIPPAPDTAQLVASWEARVAEAVEARIGEAKRDFNKEEMRQLIERAMRDELKVDLAYMNLGGVRDLFKTGTLRKRNVWNLMPFDNLIVTGKFKGSQLPDFIREKNPIDPDREYTFAVSDFTASTDGANKWKLTFPEQGPLLRDVIIQWIEKVKTVE
jgi:2',3'-cyclic-nucleotide 2'-phosphodiesterase (5'-nucleotidase family)